MKEETGDLLEDVEAMIQDNGSEEDARKQSVTSEWSLMSKLIKQSGSSVA